MLSCKTVGNTFVDEKEGTAIAALEFDSLSSRIVKIDVDPTNIYLIPVFMVTYRPKYKVVVCKIPVDDKLTARAMYALGFMPDRGLWDSDRSTGEYLYFSCNIDTFCSEG